MKNSDVIMHKKYVKTFWWFGSVSNCDQIPSFMFLMMQLNYEKHQHSHSSLPLGRMNR